MQHNFLLGSYFRLRSLFLLNIYNWEVCKTTLSGTPIVELVLIVYYYYFYFIKFFFSFLTYDLKDFDFSITYP